MAPRVQDFLPVEEIRDGVVILKGGDLRAVLMCSSINFDLKSHDEQIAILNQYQNFLNSLDFTVQLYVQSRNLDIRPYVSLLENRMREQLNELIKIQTREYVEFVKTVTEQTNVMSKSFFIIIPYTPTFAIAKQSGSIFSKLLGGGTSNNNSKEKMERFEEHRSQLEQRRNVVASGLASLGIRTAALGTEELVELYYKIMNPGDANVPVVENTN